MNSTPDSTPFILHTKEGPSTNLYKQGRPLGWHKGQRPCCERYNTWQTDSIEEPAWQTYFGGSQTQTRECVGDSVPHGGLQFSEGSGHFRKVSVILSQAVAVSPVLHGTCSLGLQPHPLRLFLLLEPCRHLISALITKHKPGGCKVSVSSELQESLAAA